MCHFRFIIAIAGLLIGVAASGAGAQSTRPATRPTPVPAAFTLPRGVYMMLGSSRFTTTQSITGVSFSPDGSRLITTHSPNPPRVWGTQSGLLQVTLASGGNGAVSASFVGNDRIAVAGMTGGMSLHDSNTGEVVRSIVEPDTDSMRHVVGSADGTRIIAVSGRIRLLNAADLSVVADLGPIEQPMMTYRGRSVMFSADSRVFLTVGDGGKLRLNESATGQAIDLPAGIPATTRNLAALSPDGSRVAIFDNRPRVFDVRSGDEIRPPEPDPAAAPAANPIPTYLDFAKGNDALLTAATNRLRIVELSSGNHILDLAAGSRATASRDGMKLAISSGRSVHVFDTSTGKPIHSNSGHMNRITAIAASPDGQSVLSADASGTVLRWDVRMGAIRGIARADAVRVIERVAFSSDGKTSYLQPAGAQPVLLDAITLQPREQQPRQIERTSRNGFSASPDLGLFAGATSTRIVRVRQMIGGDEVATFPDIEGSGLIDSIAFSPDAGSIAVSDSNKKIRVYHVRDQGLLRTIDDPGRSGASRLAWSPEDNLLARWDTATIVLFDLTTGVERARIVVPSTQAAVFSPDALFLVVTRQNEVLVFDTTSGSRLLRMASSSVQPAATAFVGNSARLALGDADGKVMIFDLPLLLRTGQLQAIASDELFKRLASTNAPQALAAAAELLGRPNDLLTLTKGLAVTDDPALRFHRLIEQLSAPDPATREKAHLELERAGKAAAPTVAAAMNNPPPGEGGDRLRSIARLIGADPLVGIAPAASDSAQSIRRVIQMLEWLGDDRARDALARLANSTAGSPARSALARLDAHRAAATQPTTQP